MFSFLQAFFKILAGAKVPASIGAKTVKAASVAAKATKIAAVTKGVSELGKAMAPKLSGVPTQISQPSTITTIETQPQGQEEGRQMDLLSTIIAGRKRKNKLG